MSRFPRLSAWLCSLMFVIGLPQLKACKIAAEDVCQEEEKSTRSDCTELRDVIPPVIGTSIEIAAVTSSSIVLSWGSASDNVTSAEELQYALVVSDRVDTIDQYQDIVRLPAGAVLFGFTKNRTSFEYVGLNPGTRYAFNVAVRDLEGNVQLYTPVIQTTWDPTVTKPQSFAMIEAQAGDGEVNLSWNAAAGATSYLIRRGTSSGYYATLGRVEASPYKDQNVTNGTTYYYMVTAENLGGWTDANAELTATPTSKDTTPPSVLSLTPATGTVSLMPTEIVASLSEASQPLTADIFVITATGCSSLPTVTTVTGSEDSKSWTAALTSGSCGQSAQITVKLDPSQVKDLAGNSGSGELISRTYTLDYATPSLTFAAPSSSVLRSSLSVTIDASFFDAISTTLSNGGTGYALQTSGTATCTASLSSVTLSGARLTLSNCTGDGTVKARFQAGVLTGNGGLQNSGQTESSAVTVDNTAPSIVGMLPSDQGTFPSTIVATFSEPISNSTTPSFVIGNIVGCSGNNPSITSVTSNADRTVWTANLNSGACTGADNFNVSVDPTVLTDVAGNAGTGCPTYRYYGAVCFVGHTLVQTPEGERPLNELKPGDAVLSYNFEKGQNEISIIREVTQHRISDVTTVIDEQGRSLIGASRHKMLNPYGKGTMLKDAHSMGFATSDTRLLQAAIPMLDLVLDRNHNFYANGILVESLKARPQSRPDLAVSASPGFCFQGG